MCFNWIMYHVIEHLLKGAFVQGSCKKEQNPSVDFTEPQAAPVTAPYMIQLTAITV